MDWQDTAIILGVKYHGETSALVELLTHRHGRYRGIVYGGRSRRMQPVLQTGNRVMVIWRARLEDHLGFFKLEAMNFYSSMIMQKPFALFALQTIAIYIRLLPERAPCSILYEAICAFLENFHVPLLMGEIMVRFEMLFLEEMGIFLNLARCAMTGVKENLAWISPRSGQAVSYQAGLPWKDKLLVLPSFLCDIRKHPIMFEELYYGFELTGFFLYQNVWKVRRMTSPVFRQSFIHRLFNELSVAAMQVIK